MKGYLDYLLYNLKIGRKNPFFLILTSLLFVLSIAALLKDVPLIGNKQISSFLWWMIGLVSIMTTMFSQSIQLIKNRNSYKSAKLEDVDKELLEKLQPSKKEIEMGFIPYSVTKKDRNDIAFYSKILNSYLLINDFAVKITKDKRRIILKSIKKNSTNLFPFLDHKLVHSRSNDQLFFNEDKLCLASDIDIKNKEVCCFRGQYFDSILTNESFGRFLKTTNKKQIADARNLFPFKEIDHGFYINDISTSILSNHIGVSTIAITSDNYIVLWEQNSRDLISGSQGVSTGSGSANYTDLDQNLWLKKTISNAMERELFEECSLLHYKNKIKCETEVIGFFRWINRCGKPEFCGISKLNIPSISFMANEKEIAERLTDFEIREVSDIPRIISTIKQKFDNLSLSLTMNLLFLEELYRSEKGQDFLGRFIFQDPDKKDSDYNRI